MVNKTMNSIKKTTPLSLSNILSKKKLSVRKEMKKKNAISSFLSASLTPITKTSKNGNNKSRPFETKKFRY